MSEVIFLIEESEEGGYVARAIGDSIFTEADDLTTLHENIKEAVSCHYDSHELPKFIRLHFVREEVIAV